MSIPNIQPTPVRAGGSSPDGRIVKTVTRSPSLLALAVLLAACQTPNEDAARELAQSAAASAQRPASTQASASMEGLSEMVFDDVAAPARILLRSGTHKGKIQADLESAGATFVADGYDVVLFNVNASEKAQIIALARPELEKLRKVILDSDGSEAGAAMVSEIAMALCGGGSKTDGVLLWRVQADLFAVTPLEAESTRLKREIEKGSEVSAGNTARYALGID